ncbi:MAG: HprK rel HprK-related kinase [Bradyrhizobium sp.]|nr:HprK rel HprK-related kinase [Bradyrhizobium sp.]
MHPLNRLYLFGGLAIGADVPLAGMRDAARAVDAHPVRLAFRHGPAPSADREVFTWPGRYGMKLGVLGDAWHFSSKLDGVFIADRAIDRIDFHSSESSPTPAAVDVLTRRVLPRLAIATGALTVHGAALSQGGGAILMFGASGAGKSTLTAALARAGWHIASDDLTILRPGADGATVHPGATGVCLWADTRAALALDPVRCFAMPGYDGKLRFEPEDAPTGEPVALRALVFLERNRDVAAPRLERMPIGEAVREATRQLIALDPTAPRIDAAHRLLQVMAGVTAVKLIYPSGYTTLPAVTDLLATLL